MISEVNIIEGLSWRYATKKFDPEREVSDEDLKVLKEAIRLSASSYGLQPYTVLVIKDASLRKKLREVSMNQPQITDSSYLFVFCNKLEIDKDYVKEYIDGVSHVRNVERGNLNGFEDVINGQMASFSPEQMKHWTAKQAYIALGTLLVACGEMEIDACPMEGFDSKAYDEILGLKEKGLTAAALTAIGYRSEEDIFKDAAKVRKDDETLFVNI